MNPGLFDMFHDGRDEGIGAIGDGIRFGLNRMVEEFIDQNGTIRCDAHGGRHIVVQHRLIVDDLHTTATLQRLPPPAGDPEAPLQALIFDAQYDPYRGAVLLVRVMEGSLRPGQKILLMHTGKEYDVEEVGLLQLRRVEADELGAGMVGYVIAGVKAVSEIAVGDTITDAEAPADAPLPGYKEAKSVVFSSMYPMSTEEYPELTKALEKLKLNDAALTYEKDSSAALGFGFRCGFLDGAVP